MGCPVGCFGQGVLSLQVWVALCGAGLAWAHLSFLPELQDAADTSISACIPAQVPTDCAHLCILHSLLLREQDPLSGQSYEHLCALTAAPGFPLELLSAGSAGSRDL